MVFLLLLLLLQHLGQLFPLVSSHRSLQIQANSVLENGAENEEDAGDEPNVLHLDRTGSRRNVAGK